MSSINDEAHLRIPKKRNFQMDFDMEKRIGAASVPAARWIVPSRWNETPSHINCRRDRRHRVLQNLRTWFARQLCWSCKMEGVPLFSWVCHSNPVADHRHPIQLFFRNSRIHILVCPPLIPPDNEKSLLGKEFMLFKIMDLGPGVKATNHFD